MIEVNVKEKEKTVEKIEFPVLMKSLNSGIIVLFISETIGVCVDKGDSNKYIGLYSDSWIECTSQKNWEKFEGEITLKNK